MTAMDIKSENTTIPETNLKEVIKDTATNVVTDQIKKSVTEGSLTDKIANFVNDYTPPEKKEAQMQNNTMDISTQEQPSSNPYTGVENFSLKERYDKSQESPEVEQQPLIDPNQQLDQDIVRSNNWLQRGRFINNPDDAMNRVKELVDAGRNTGARAIDTSGQLFQNLHEELETVHKNLQARLNGGEVEEEKPKKKSFFGSWFGGADEIAAPPSFQERLHKIIDANQINLANQKARTTNLWKRSTTNLRSTCGSSAKTKTKPEPKPTGFR